MTIKQQGGVFGRNPTFNDVDVAGDLTVGGSITNTGTQNITGQLNVDNVRIDGNTVSTTDTNGNLLLTPNGTGSVLTAKTLTGINTRVTRKILNNWAGQGNGVGFENTARYEVGAGNDVVRAFLAAGYNTAGVYPNVGAVGTLTNHPLAIHINNGKVAEFTTTGNLAFNNGLGIDFSATAGTGTSELFSDYEEGTWTPTFTAEWTTAPTVTSAQYTKIGRQVTVALLATGGVVTAAGGIGGLPFASNAAQGAGAYGGNSDTTESLQGTVGQAASSITNIPARTLTGDTWQITATYFT